MQQIQLIKRQGTENQQILASSSKQIIEEDSEEEKLSGPKRSQRSFKDSKEQNMESLLKSLVDYIDTKKKKNKQKNGHDQQRGGSMTSLKKDS